jgi:hypothetical protein
MHVEQPTTDRQLVIECPSTCLKIGSTEFTVTHDSESVVSHDVHALDEVVAVREGGKGKVGTSNLKFWKRRAHVSTPNNVYGNDGRGVGQKRKGETVGGVTRSGENNHVVGRKHQKSEYSALGMAEAVQQPRQSL